MSPEQQLYNAFVALIITILTGFGLVVAAWFKLLPKRMETQIQQSVSQFAMAADKAKTENIVDQTTIQVVKDLAEGVLSSVAELRKMNETQATSGGQLTSLKSDVDKISKTLETGSKPLLDIGAEVKRILAIVEDIQRAPHLSDDKAKRLDDAVAQIGVVTRQLSELVVALQETRDDLLRKKLDSKPIPAIPKDQFDTSVNGKEQ